jgi:hypothetical protein
MAVAHTTALNLIGKYVEFTTDNIYPHIGIIDSVSIYLDGRIEISFDTVEFYDLSQISKFKILGEVKTHDPEPFDYSSLFS